MVGLVVSLVLMLGVAARAADYPTHPVKLIVPTAPGGINDIVARLIQPGLTEALKQPIVIENKTGANNIIGTDFVAKSAPDGYTLVVVPASHSVNPAVQAKMPFNTEKDLSPIILIGKNAMLFLVNPKVPAKSLREFAALAKAGPNKFSFATPGTASQSHLVISQWDNMAGVEAIHIPYRGGAPATLATISGETQFTVMSSLLAAPQVAAGKLRALAIGSLISLGSMVMASQVGETAALRLHATELLMLLGTAIVLLVEPPVRAETNRSAMAEDLPLQQPQFLDNR